MATVTTRPSLQRTIAGSAGIVMACVVVGQGLGFFREWTLAHQVGSNALTDAYYAAFTLPNIVNYMIAGGALSFIFVPVFSQYLAEDREEEGWHVFSTVATFMGLLLIVVVGLGEIFAAPLVGVIAPGFPPAQKAQVVFLTRLMLPAQFCFVMGSILSSVQYAKSRFFIPPLAQAVYNLMVVLGGWLLAPYIGITGFAVGALTGAMSGNLLLQIYGATRVGARFHPNLDLRHPGFRLFLKMAIPIMLALSLTSTDDWIIRWFGSYLQAASITWLTYAKTLMRVPITTVGQAFGVAALPVLARLYSEKKFDELNRTFNSILKGQLLLTVPIAALTIALSKPLIYFVFSHTRLRGPDFQATAAALALFSVGMFIWSAQGLVSRCFYAMQNSWTPALVGTSTTILSLPLYYLLVHRLQYRGLAVASSCGIAIYVLTLLLLLTRRTSNRAALSIVPFFLKLGGASAIAAFASFRLTEWLEARIEWRTTHGSFLVLALGSAAGFLLIILLAKILKLRELEQLPVLIRRRRMKVTAPLEAASPQSINP
jgi:putative peptidoglycan lipid II flippase